MDPDWRLQLTVPNDAVSTRAPPMRAPSQEMMQENAPSLGSREVGSAQCRSSKTSTAGCVRAPAKYHAVTAASCRRRNSSGANFAERSSGNGMSTSGAIRGAYSSGSRPTKRSVFSRSARRPSSVASAPPERCLPIRRAGAGACSAGAAKRPIRPRCVASPRVLREIPRSGVTCRCRARRRSGRTDPRLRVRATNGVSAAQARPRGRRTALARAPRPVGRRRSPARRDRRDRRRHAL